MSSKSTKGAIYFHMNQMRYSDDVWRTPDIRTKFKEKLKVNNSLKRLVLHLLKLVTGSDEKGQSGCERIKYDAKNSGTQVDLNYCDVLE